MKKAPCLYCGTSQTNHAFAWFDELIGIGSGRLNRSMSRWWLTRVITRGIDAGTPAILAGLTAVRLIGWNTDSTLVQTPRGKVLWEEAVARGIAIRNVTFFGRQLDAYEATRGTRTIVYTGVPTGGTDTLDSAWWLDDKAILKRKLIAIGVPVGQGGSFTSWKKLKARFDTLSKPVIIKPRTGSRGRHTTTSIFTEDELREAYAIARQLGPYVVMEEHLIGSVYRGTVVDGELVAILRGDPPRITGDGVHTIAALIEKQNAARAGRVGAIELSTENLDFLLRNGYTPKTILPLGTTIDTSSKVGLSYGGMSREVTPESHPKIKDYLERAAAMINFPVIGFDFIIQDIAQDPDTQRWGIIEGNSAPFIQLHHFPLEGAPVNVAAKVWDMMERKQLI